MGGDGDIVGLDVVVGMEGDVGVQMNRLRW